MAGEHAISQFFLAKFTHGRVNLPIFWDLGAQNPYSLRLQVGLRLWNFHYQWGIPNQPATPNRTMQRDLNLQVFQTKVLNQIKGFGR